MHVTFGRQTRCLEFTKKLHLGYAEYLLKNSQNTLGIKYTFTVEVDITVKTPFIQEKAGKSSRLGDVSK